MSKKKINVAKFEIPGKDYAIEVSRITPDKARAAARDIQRIGQAAYRLAFEQTSSNPTRPLSPGSITEHLFKPGSESRVRSQSEKIEEGFKHGVAYWALYYRSANVDTAVIPPAMVGVVKTSPSPLKPWERWFREGNCFINDAMVVPMHQYEGLATAGVYTALHDYSDNKEVLTHLFDNSSQLNEAIQHYLPFTTAESITAFPIGRQALGQHRFGGLSVGQAKQRLTDRQPWLVDVDIQAGTWQL